MPKPALVPADNPARTSAAEPHSGDDLSELRALIVGPEQREIRALQYRLSDPAFQVQEVSRVLPDALALRATDPRLIEAVAPSVEEALTASVRKNPQPLADALFPIMGPAIRKAIAHALNAMMESFNRTLEYSLSWRSLRWRLEALRTGKSFAEIVLLHTLVYRVEQVFLIQPASGLLMQHVAADRDARHAADQISAMLTAIRDFVQDSFGVTAGHTLETLRVGDLEVHVEPGPHAVLAGVVRGAMPETLRTLFQETLEAIHLRYSPELEAFSGDSDSLAAVRPLLQSCLQTVYRPRQTARSYRRWGFAALILLALGAWGIVRIREGQRWDAYIDQLRQTPGIVVIASGRSDGKYVVSGLRDPMSEDPDLILRRSGMAADAAEGRWEFYQASDPEFVLARAQHVLRPPEGVSLAMRNDVLVASGAAPSQWIRENARLALVIPGVRQFDRSRLAAADLQTVKTDVESIAIQFARGSPTPIGDDARAKLAAALGQLNDIARLLDQQAEIEIAGHTDSDGPPSSNVPLSIARAQSVLALLPASELSSLRFTMKGAGSAEPVSQGGTDVDKQRNRRVQLTVRVLPLAAPGDRQP